METKEWVMVVGILATFIIGFANLIFNLHNGKRTAFVNTVTSERIKWIGKVRENISKLLSICVIHLKGRSPNSTSDEIYQ
jgi:hypothetical protein